MAIDLIAIDEMTFDGMAFDETACDELAFDGPTSNLIYSFLKNYVITVSMCE